MWSRTHFPAVSPKSDFKRHTFPGFSTYFYWRLASQWWGDWDYKPLLACEGPEGSKSQRGCDAVPSMERAQGSVQRQILLSAVGFLQLKWNTGIYLCIILIHTDTTSEVTISTVATVVLLALAKHFFSVWNIKKSEHTGKFSIFLPLICFLWDVTCLLWIQVAKWMFFSLPFLNESWSRQVFPCHQWEFDLSTDSRPSSL